MSQENVALVRRLLEDFRRRDHERAFESYDPEIVWDTSHMPDDVFAGLAGVYHGHEGVRAYWREWLEAWSDIQFDVQDILDAGDDVVALIHNQRQWGRSSGIATETPPYALVFTVRGGKVTRWRAYMDQQEALASVGLQE